MYKYHDAKAHRSRIYSRETGTLFTAIINQQTKVSKINMQYVKANKYQKETNENYP